MNNKLENIQKELQNFIMIRSNEIKQGVITREEFATYEQGIKDAYQAFKIKVETPGFIFSFESMKDFQSIAQNLKDNKLSFAFNGDLTQEELEQYNQGLKITYLTFKEKLENRLPRRLDKFSV